eukprot:gene5396-5412_t
MVGTVVDWDGFAGRHAVKIDDKEGLVRVVLENLEETSAPDGGDGVSVTSLCQQ